MELKIKTKKREEIVDITDKIRKIIKESKTEKGVCFIYVPHATAAITINENTDPNVGEDILNHLRQQIPQGKWKHDRIDRNADAHIKSSLIGVSVTVPIENGSLMLGAWQGVILCEFDGPRERKVIIKILK